MLFAACDTLVAGAGIVGASVAWRLARAGARVCLLDAGAFGSEASWAGAGMLAPGGEVESASPWAAFALESLAMYPAFVEELQAESGRAIDYRPSGAVDLAGTAEDWTALANRCREQAPLGIPSEALDPRAVAEAVPGLGVSCVGGAFYPADALVDPRTVLAGLRAACKHHGVQVVEGCRVHALILRAGGVEADTAAGKVAAETAVLAAGAWSSEIAITGAPAALAPAVPVRGHLAGYHMPVGTLGPILRDGRNYLLQRASGLVVAGSSMERVGFDRRIDPAIVAGLHAAACRLLPALRAAGPPEPWLGFRPAVEAPGPCVGRFHGTRLWLAYGHFRNGILLAPATAHRIAGSIIASSGMG